MEKNNCYIYWDGDEVLESERKVYVQCEKCFIESKKGFKWSKELLSGTKEIKCGLCDAIIYKKVKKKKKEP